MFVLLVLPFAVIGGVMIKKRAASGNFDLSKYPPAFQVAPSNPTFNAKYDLSSVPQHTLSLPHQSGSGPSCSADQMAGISCSWTCTQCKRPTDIISCNGKQDWGISYDDGNNIHSNYRTFTFNSWPSCIID